MLLSANITNFIATFTHNIYTLVMKYKVIRNPDYDFVGESYSTKFPNIHKYPATMLPQIGIKILKEINVKGQRLLDPYCGSGSSFVAGLQTGFNEMKGYDINPLAVLISKVKFTKIEPNILDKEIIKLRNAVFEFLKQEKNFSQISVPNIKNID